MKLLTLSKAVVPFVRIRYFSNRNILKTHGEIQMVQDIRYFSNRNILKTLGEKGMVQDIRFFSNRNILKTLGEKGMVQDVFPGESETEIANLLSSAARCLYAGFDPTADSLHVGNLLVLMGLIHAQRAGHSVVALIGGATGRIGDPSGKNVERPEISQEVLDNNLNGIKRDIVNIFHNHEKYFWTAGKNMDTLPPLQIVNNEVFYKDMNIIEFLGTIGRHFRLGRMLSRQSVKSRLESDQGISLTEFAYQTFQAYDWLQLYRERECLVQLGGSDQMGNLAAGQELISRVAHKQVYGHLVCSECQPSLVRCPICNVKFRKNIITRDFFAEKVLDQLERRCRYELFDCEFKSRSSDALVLHETVCDHKPPVPVKRKRNVQTNTDRENVNNDLVDDEEEDENEIEEEEEDEDDVMLEDIFVSNFAFVLVLLRAYILEFGDMTKHNHLYLEYFLLFLLCVWVYYVWQENGIAHAMDDTSPFIAMYFVIVVLSVVIAKTLYGDCEGKAALAVEGVDPGGGVATAEGVAMAEDTMLSFLWYLKPAVTLMTGVFCSVVHVYVYDLREESWFVLGCVLSVSFLFAAAEVIWDLASTLDQMYFVIFWLQSFFIVLPFGMIGRHFLDF